MSKIVAIPETVDQELQKVVTSWATDFFGPTMLYDDALQDSIDQWGLPWFRAGAVVSNSEGKILMMHEGRIQVKKIKDEFLKNQYLAEGCSPNDWVDGDGGWNIPAGRLQPGESFEDAVIREVKEESQWDVKIKCHLYTRRSEKIGNAFIMPVYLAEAISGPKVFRSKETLEIGWFTVAEIREMHADGKLRSPESVLGSLAAYIELTGLITRKEERREFYSDEQVLRYLREFGLPTTRVAVLLRNYKARNDLILLVNEKVAKDTDGRYQGATDVWGLPSGCVKLGESLESAAHRIAREETGYEVTIERLCHVGDSVSSSQQYVMLVYLAVPKGDQGEITSSEIRTTAWKTLPEMVDLANNGYLRNADLAFGSIRGYSGGKCNLDSYHRQQ